MATTQLRLSKKVGDDGKAQVIVKLTINRNSRPCFKTGVFINPSYFKVVKETPKGVVMGIVPPKKGKLNYSEVKEANNAKAAVNVFVTRLLAVCNAITSHGDEATHESISEALNLTNDIPADEITYGVIQTARERGERMKVKASMTFFDWYRLFIEEHGKELSEQRIKLFEVVGRMFGRYEGFHRATDDNEFTLNIDTFDKDMTEDFHDYLVNEKSLSEEYPHIFEKLVKLNPVQRSDHKQRVKNRGNNAMSAIMKIVREFFNWLFLQGVTTNRPFAKIKLESEKYGTPFYLTLEERNLIADTDMKEASKNYKPKGCTPRKEVSLETQRDIFIFQCCVGCRVSDLMRFKPSNIDKGVLSYIPLKTKNENVHEVRVPLNNRALTLVEKYRGKDAKGRLFPFISKDKYNDAIKDVIRICGVERTVTTINSVTGAEEQHPIWEVASSHMARRTFIGNLYKEIKDPNLIGSMSGHAPGSKAFARYRAIDDDTKKEVVSMIN